jgi:hypothetical protein
MFKNAIADSILERGCARTKEVASVPADSVAATFRDAKKMQILKNIFLGAKNGSKASWPTLQKN